LGYFSTILHQGKGNRFQVTLAIDTSLEHRQDQVSAAFQTMLGRLPDPVTQNVFVAYLGHGATVSQIDVVLASTPEYFQKHGGGTNSGFVSALFQDGLNRAVDPGSQTAFLNGQTAGMSRTQLAQVVFFSQEFQQDTIQALFNEFLNHPASAAALASFTQALEQNGLHDEIITMIVGGSQEFFNLV